MRDRTSRFGTESLPDSAAYQLSCLESLPPVPSHQNLEDSALVAGVDEVGRGCLFGPVVAAAVLIRHASSNSLFELGITDSKRLSAAQRQAFVAPIHHTALDCQIGIASVSEIDRLNILQASLLAMKRAVLKLACPADLCLVDGNQRIPKLDMPQQTIIKGDQTIAAIAAASILAKVWRDDLIVRLAARYPKYDLASNKGYGTPPHRRALAKYGPSVLHRRSFRPCNVAAPQTDV